MEEEFRAIVWIEHLLCVKDFLVFVEEGAKKNKIASSILKVI